MGVARPVLAADFESSQRFRTALTEPTAPPWSAGMSLIARSIFERRLVSHLNEIEPGLVYSSKRKIGCAWAPIIDHMYAKHAQGLTFANTREVIAGCANEIIQLTDQLK